MQTDREEGRVGSLVLIPEWCAIIISIYLYIYICWLPTSRRGGESTRQPDDCGLLNAPSHLLPSNTHTDA